MPEFGIFPNLTRPGGEDYHHPNLFNLSKKCYNEGMKAPSKLERYLLTMVETDFIKEENC